MFTGLIEEIGTIIRLQENRVEIACTTLQQDLKTGDSVAVNGVCLTVIHSSYGSRPGRRSIQAEIMPVTLRTTNLGRMLPGSKVNLERALRAGDRFGGHLVSGHVDGTGSVAAVRREGPALLITLELQETHRNLVIPKGSIAIDGISLTVAQLSGSRCTVSLVGHTATSTTLAARKSGDLVNIEYDMIGKYIQSLMEKTGYSGEPSGSSGGPYRSSGEPSGTFAESLRTHGFYA
jgi:riboflavin synthase